jgi:hypothetical protein
VSTNHVVINEVYPSPDRFHGVDPQNEWVELYNPTNFAVDVSGWTICNSVGVLFYQRHLLSLPKVLPF